MTEESPAKDEAPKPPEEAAAPCNCLIQFRCSQAHGFCAVNYIHAWAIVPDCGEITVEQRLAEMAKKFHNNGYTNNHFTGRIFPEIYLLQFTKKPSPRELALRIIRYFSAPNIIRLADVVSSGMHAYISDHLKHGDVIESDHGWTWKVVKHEPLRNYNSGNMVQEVDLMQARHGRYGNRV